MQFFLSINKRKAGKMGTKIARKYIQQNFDSILLVFTETKVER